MLAQVLKEGKIVGVVSLVRCSNTRVVYEKAVADVAAKMIENNILALTNCCASFPL